MLLRSALVSLAVCMLFASSPVLADECSEALMAESCTCQFATRNELAKQVRSDKHSATSGESRISKKAGTPVAKLRPATTAPAD